MFSSHGFEYCQFINCVINPVFHLSISVIPEFLPGGLLVSSHERIDYAGLNESWEPMSLRSIFVLLVVCLLTFVTPSLASDVDSYLKDGVQRSEAGDYRGALIEFNKAIELDPENAKIYQYRGIAKAKYGDFEGSIIDYSKSIELDSSNVDSYGSRGIAKARSGDVAGAILDFDVAIQMNPDDGTAYFNHGMAMEMTNDLQHACLDWNRGIELGNVQSVSFYRKYCQ